jgi:hypothetical protein
MWLGQWRNVWLADCRQLPDTRIPVLNSTLPNVLKDLSYRKEFAGQFWIGIAAWPAIVQYHTTELIELKQDDIPADKRKRPEPNSIFGTHMQAPIEADLNDLQRNSDKRWDLGWVYTVIAGMLNILVIYDALAGPVVREEKSGTPNAPGGGTV